MSASARQFKVIEANATTVAASSSWDITHLTLLTNDGTDDITFTFDNGTPFTLKKGEKFEDIALRVTTLHYTAASGTQAFRALGIRQ